MSDALDLGSPLGHFHDESWELKQHNGSVCSPFHYHFAEKRRSFYSKKLVWSIPSLVPCCLSSIPQCLMAVCGGGRGKKHGV